MSLVAGFAPSPFDALSVGAVLCPQLLGWHWVLMLWQDGDIRTQLMLLWHLGGGFGAGQGAWNGQAGRTAA